MQYGKLTLNQQEMLIAKQEGLIRKPTFVLWIEGFGDTTEYVMKIDTDVGMESLRGRGNINIGRTIIELDNENRYFYDNDSSMVKPYSRMKVWCGFDGINVPIFTGVVLNVKPIGSQNIVIMNCCDYMGLLSDAIVSDISNNNPKSIIEHFCLSLGLLSNICENEETLMVYSEVNIKGQRMINALEKICDSIFHVAYFDEDGVLRLREREFSNFVNWEFNDKNVVDCELLSGTEIINEVNIEYRNGYFSRSFNQASVSEYKVRQKQIRVPSLGFDYVSEKLFGHSEEVLNFDLKGFKFTSSEDSSIIDTLYIRLKGVESSGYISVRIYTDNNGVPDELIGISNVKVLGNLRNEFAWELFCFYTPIRISGLANYWCIIDTSLMTSGSVYAQISKSGAIGKQAYYDSFWQIENNKQILHIIKGSRQSQRVAEDIVRFYKKPYERVKIIAPAIPHLQLFDEILLNIRKMEIAGRYIVERRRHFLTGESYTTMDVLRKVG